MSEAAPFDKAGALRAVQGILDRTPLPGTNRSILSLGLVARVSAEDGRVVVILSPSKETAGEGLARMKETLRLQIEAIPGVARAEVLERLPAGDAAPPQARPISGVRNVVAVASGKGGVGKSTVAVNAAAACARDGLRVGLLDADIYGPSVPIMTGARARPAVGEDRTILPVEACGVRTVSIGSMLDDDAPVLWRGPLVTSILRQFLFEVRWGELDLLVVDLPPGTGDAQLTLVQSAVLRGGLIVTTPQAVALEDVRRAMTMFRRVGVEVLGIVENMSAYVCPSCGHREAIFDAGGARRAAERFGVPLLGEIPIDPSIRRAGDEGRPIVLAHPDGPAAQAFRRVAEAVTRACARSPEPSP